MNIQKHIIGKLNKCYSIAPLYGEYGCRFLVAAEKNDPCYLFSEDGSKLETVWSEPGGVMTMAQVPGKENQFLATQKFYSPNDSAEAKIVVATRRAENDWQVRTLVNAPFVHRFGILSRNGANYLLICCLKSGHSCKDDWSQPGRTFAALLPDDLDQLGEGSPLALTLLKDNMCHNHGYSMYCDNGIETGIVSCDSGVYQFIPPASVGGSWQIRQLYDQPVSDAVLCDFDQDGCPELGCIAPFHGDQLYICHQTEDGGYKKVWQFPEYAEMLHATWACSIQGKPAWIVGHRKGKRNLMLVTYEDGDYRTTLIDQDCGSANAFHFVNRSGQDIILSANRETDEIAMYQVDGKDIKNE